MVRRPPVYTRIDPPFPGPPLFRSPALAAEAAREAQGAFDPVAAFRFDFAHDEDPVASTFQGSRAIQRDGWDYRAGLRGVLPLGLSYSSSYGLVRSDEHTSELPSLMRNSYDVFCLQKKN